MNRLEMKKAQDEYADITLTHNDGVELDIWFARNLDLYFALNGTKISNKFIIDESNMRVYDAFSKLYESLINCKLPFKVSDENFLKWKSDDYSFDTAPSFKIEKVEKKFIITFIEGIQNEQSPEKKDTISVRIRNSGSFHDQFNVSFMNLFHDLLKIDLEQVYIDEIMNLKRTKK